MKRLLTTVALCAASGLVGFAAGYVTYAWLEADEIALRIGRQ